MLSYLRPDMLSLLLPVAVYGGFWLFARHDDLNPRYSSDECEDCKNGKGDGECPICDGYRMRGDW